MTTIDYAQTAEEIFGVGHVEINGVDPNLGRRVLAIAEHLPHGSGIDEDWQIMAGNGSIRCFNEYHAMDGSGMYVGYVPFELIINRRLEIEIDIDGGRDALLALGTWTEEIDPDYQPDNDVIVDDEADNLAEYLYQVCEGLEKL